MEGLKEVASFLAPAVAALSGREEGVVRKQSSTGKVVTVPQEDWRSPVYGLIAANVAVFLLGMLVPLGGLTLSMGQQGRWWQVLTSGWMHTSAQHLAETTFIIYMFGRLIERSHGGWALWGTYLASALGANLLALWLLPARAAASTASSAAAVGLFVAGLLWPRLSRKPLEVAVLAPWVLTACVSRYMVLRPALTSQGTPVGHLVHVVGAVVAASLVAGALRVVDLIKDQLEQQRLEEQRKEADKLRAARANADGQAMAEAMEQAARAASAIAKKLL